MSEVDARAKVEEAAEHRERADTLRGWGMRDLAALHDEKAAKVEEALRPKEPPGDNLLRELDDAAAYYVGRLNEAWAGRSVRDMDHAQVRYEIAHRAVVEYLRGGGSGG